MFTGTKPDGKSMLERVIELLSMQQNVKRKCTLKEVKK